jgi:hypothetical protein
MRIEFSAYADDYIVRGDVAFDAERLADFLEATHDIELSDVQVRALDDGREHDLPSATIRREELCAVSATGPRGRPDRRLRTRAYPMRAVVGPYSIVGYFQALPTADPWAILQRHQIVALSPARVAFDVAGQPHEETHATLLLLRDKIDTIQHASDDDISVTRPIEVPA